MIKAITQHGVTITGAAAAGFMLSAALVLIPPFAPLLASAALQETEPPVCDNDGVCDPPTETTANCGDCPSTCGDSICAPSEVNICCGAGMDCTLNITCGTDGVCSACETFENCPADCPRAVATPTRPASTATFSASFTPSATPTPTATITGTPPPTATRTQTPTDTATATDTDVPTATDAPTATETDLPTATGTAVEAADGPEQEEGTQEETNPLLLIVPLGVTGASLPMMLYFFLRRRRHPRLPI